MSMPAPLKIKTKQERYDWMKESFEMGKTIGIHTYTRTTVWKPKTVAKFGGFEKAFRMSKSGCLEMVQGRGWVDIGGCGISVQYT